MVQRRDGEQGDPLAAFGVQARRLIDRLSGVSIAWYSAHPIGLPVITRAQLLRDLIAQLAVLGREGGTGTPEGAAPPLLADHALADQVAVLAADLLAAPRGQQVADQAVAALTGCAQRLWGGERLRR